MGRFETSQWGGHLGPPLQNPLTLAFSQRERGKQEGSYRWWATRRFEPTRRGIRVTPVQAGKMPASPKQARCLHHKKASPHPGPLPEGEGKARGELSMVGYAAL